MPQAPSIPRELLAKAVAQGWSSERAAADMFGMTLARGFSVHQIGVALDMGLTPERAHQLLETAPLKRRRDSTAHSDEVSASGETEFGALAPA